MKNGLYLLGFLCLLLTACGDDDAITPTDPDTFELPGLEGRSQKGPYLNGSTVQLQELDKDLDMTGRSFSGSITDNSGAFTFGALTLASPVVDMQTNGFYYNEVTGGNSSAQLSLTALVDLTDLSRANVNILSHLSRARIRYLIDTEAMTFLTARAQAEEEVYAMLEFTPPAGAASFDQLDISQAGQGNAALLAASVIFQGRRQTAALTQLLADIAGDLRTDGILDDASLGSALITDVLGVNLAVVRANLTQRYAALGENAVIPAFEPYIRQFIDNTGFTPDSVFEYPEEGFHGPNLLADVGARDTLFVSNSSGGSFSLTAIVPENNSLTLRMTGNRTQGNIAYTLGTDQGWELTSPDTRNDPTVFEVTGDGTPTQYRIIFFGAGQLTFELFENEATTPTHTRVISWGTPIDLENDRPVYPDSLEGAANILALIRDGVTELTPGDYVFAITVPETYDIGLTLELRMELSASHELLPENAGDFDILIFPAPGDNDPFYLFQLTSFGSQRGTTLSMPFRVLPTSDRMNLMYQIAPESPPTQNLEDLLEDYDVELTW